jgi:hypothetical protein
VVTSSISRFNPPAQFSRGAHRGRVCVCVHRGECMPVYVSVCVCTVFLKKTMFFLTKRPGY